MAAPSQRPDPASKRTRRLLSATCSRFRWTPEADRDLRRLVEDEWAWQWPGWNWVATMMDGRLREGTFTAAQCRSRYARIVGANHQLGDSQTSTPV